MLFKNEIHPRSNAQIFENVPLAFLKNRKQNAVKVSVAQEHFFFIDLGFVSQ